MASLHTAVFLDRDGTLNVEKGYLRQVADLELLPGAAQAVRALNDAGIPAILTTNQTGAARGFYPVSHIEALHHRLDQCLAEEAGAHLDAIFYCPHLSKGVVSEFAIDCRCRKPLPGMIEAACRQFPTIDPIRSYVIGDKVADIDFGYAAGCRPLLVTTGYGQRVLEGKYQTLTQPPFKVFPSVLEAVRYILESPLYADVPFSSHDA